jgi:hypothetical protein
MPAPNCRSCGAFLNQKWGKDADGRSRPRHEWQCPRHGTLLTCGTCCPQCPKRGHGGSDLRGARLVAAAVPAAVASALAAPAPLLQPKAPPVAPPAAPPEAPPGAPPAAAAVADAGRVQGPAPRSRSPRALRMTPRELQERMRSQHRFLEGRADWPLQPGWNYGARASTWSQAVHLPLTTWWLRKLEAGSLRCVKLQIFLRWVQQQRAEEQQRAEGERKRQQELERGSGGSGDLRIPPCVACLDSPPTQLCQPCGHLCLCEGCSLRLLQAEEPGCPVCRGRVQSFTRAWY